MLDLTVLSRKINFRFDSSSSILVLNRHGCCSQFERFINWLVLSYADIMFPSCIIIFSTSELILLCDILFDLAGVSLTISSVIKHPCCCRSWLLSLRRVFAHNSIAFTIIILQCQLELLKHLFILLNPIAKFFQSLDLGFKLFNPLHLFQQLGAYFTHIL